MKDLLKKLEEAFEIADFEAFDEEGLTKVQNAIEECTVLVRAAVNFDDAPNDAAFEPPHKIFQMAQDIDNKTAELKSLKVAAISLLLEINEGATDDWPELHQAAIPVRKLVS